MIEKIYAFIPLVISLSFLYSALRLSRIIKHPDKERQADYEEYHQSNNNSLRIIGSVLGGIIFFLCFLMSY